MSNALVERKLLKPAESASKFTKHRVKQPNSKLHKLSSELLLLISQFMQFQELASFAAGSRLFNALCSARLSKDLPASAAVLRRESINQLPQTSEGNLIRLFSRLSRLQTVSIERRVRFSNTCLLALLKQCGHNLRVLHIRSFDGKLSFKSMSLILSSCLELTSLEIPSLNDPIDDSTPLKLPAHLNLRSLSVQEITPHLLAVVLSACPSVTSLAVKISGSFHIKSLSERKSLSSLQLRCQRLIGAKDTCFFDLRSLSLFLIARPDESFWTQVTFPALETLLIECRTSQPFLPIAYCIEKDNTLLPKLSKLTATYKADKCYKDRAKPISASSLNKLRMLRQQLVLEVD